MKHHLIRFGVGASTALGAFALFLFVGAFTNAVFFLIGLGLIIIALWLVGDTIIALYRSSDYELRWPFTWKP